MIESGSTSDAKTCEPQRIDGRRPGGVRWHRSVLLGVLLLAGALRLGGITRVGIRYDDESWYASDARLWHRCARVLTDGEAIRAVFRGDKPALQQRMDAIGVDFAGRYDKPCRGYTFLGALMMFVVGDGPAALLVTNALCGTLSVLVLYVLACVLFSRSVGLCAALVLAVSPYHLVYCRSALTDATVGMFVLLGILAWSLGRRGLWTWKWAYLCAGIALGYAILCHFRSAYVPVVLLAFDLLVPPKTCGAPERTPCQEPGPMRRLTHLAAGIAIPILAMEAAFQAAYLAAAITDSYLPGTAYLENCLQHIGMWARAASLDVVDGGAGSTSVLGAYPTYFMHWHGIPATIATAIGLLVVVRLRGPAKWAAVLVIVNLGILLLQRHTVARAVSPVVPFACLCLAVGIHRLISLGRLPTRLTPVLALVTCALLAWPAFQRSCELHGKRSHLADACAFVAGRAGAVAVPLDPMKYALYLENAETEVVVVDTLRRLRPSGTPQEVVEKLRDKGVRWMITDAQNWHYRNSAHSSDTVFRWCLAMEEHLAQNASLAVEFPHMVNYRWEFMSEGWGLAHLPEMIEKGGGPLRIYDLQAPVDVAADRKTQQTTMSSSVFPPG